MRDMDRAPSRGRLVSSRTASFESLTDEGTYEEGGSAGPAKRRDSSWDSKWRQQVTSNETPPFIRRIGGSPGRLNNAKWEEKAGGSGTSSPMTPRRRLFKSPSMERRCIRTPPPPLPPSIPETNREASSSSSSESSSAHRPDSVPMSPRTVRRKLVIRAAKTPSPLPKEWANVDHRVENEACYESSTSKSQSRTSESCQKSSLEKELKNESIKIESKDVEPDLGVRKSSSISPRHSGTFTAIPVMAVSDEEAPSSSPSRNPSLRIRSSPEKKKFLNSMLNQSQESKESSSSIKYKSLGEVRSEQRSETSLTTRSQTQESSSSSYTEKNSSQSTLTRTLKHSEDTKEETLINEGSSNRNPRIYSKDQNNNDIPRSPPPKKSPSPSEHVLSSLERLVKETENMINKHLDTDESDNILRPSEAPPIPPPRSASINKVPHPTEASNYSIPPPPPPPPPKVSKIPKQIPSRLLREASPSSTISEEILNTARGLQNFEHDEEELMKAQRILEQRRSSSNEEKLLKKRLQDQKIQKEAMFRHKKEKEKLGPPPPEENETLESLIFQGSPPRPIRHTPTPCMPLESPLDYSRPSMVKATPLRTKDEVSSLREEIQNAKTSSSRRMRALQDVERRDVERMKELRRSMIEDNDGVIVHQEESFLPPPPPSLFQEEKSSTTTSEPQFVVLKDPSILPTHVDSSQAQEEDDLLKAEEKELEALRSAGQRERELLEEMERRKREIEEEIAKERLRIEELHRIENEKRAKFLSMKKNSRPRAVLQYEEMVARKMNTPSPPPPPPQSSDSDRRNTHSGLLRDSFSDETDTEGYGDEDFSLGMDIPYAEYSSDNVTPTPTTGEMAELSMDSLPPPPLPPCGGSLRSLLRSHGSSFPYVEDASRKVHFSEIDQIKVLSLESLLSTINSETSEPIYSNVPPSTPISSRVESAFNQSRNYFQVRPPQRNQVV